jgi:hypothetical protein
MDSSDSDADKNPREEPKEGASAVVIFISSDSESSDRSGSCESDSSKSEQAEFPDAPHNDEQPDTDPQPVSLFTYAMRHGKFPNKRSHGARQQLNPEPPLLTDEGFLWNAVPRRTSKYLANEAVHSGSTSSGTTGTSDGDLSDDFVANDDPQDKPAVEDLEMLAKFFPKTFAARK